MRGCSVRVHNGIPILPAEKLIGSCGKGSRNVCTRRANFHFFLSNLGKTNLSDDELELMPAPMKRHRVDIRSPHPVFLYEVSQLSDPEREHILLKDLQNFLRLQQPIPPMIWMRPGRNLTDALAAKRNARKIDICDAKFDEVRRELMHSSRNAATWLRDYFLDARDVFVSSKEHMRDMILETWMVDPCEARRDRQGSGVVAE